MSETFKFKIKIQDSRFKSEERKSDKVSPRLAVATAERRLRDAYFTVIIRVKIRKRESFVGRCSGRMRIERKGQPPRQPKVDQAPAASTGKLGGGKIHGERSGEALPVFDSTRIDSRG